MIVRIVITHTKEACEFCNAFKPIQFILQTPTIVSVEETRQIAFKSYDIQYMWHEVI